VSSCPTTRTHRCNLVAFQLLQGKIRAKFVGNRRIFTIDENASQGSRKKVYLLRKLSEETYVLSISADSAIVDGADSHYAGLDKMFTSKMRYGVEVAPETALGQSTVCAANDR
jgi:hypothetical protein